MIEIFISGLIVCALVAVNVKATLLISRDSVSSLFQKLWQMMLVWLVPIVGAIVTFAVHRPLEDPSSVYRQPLEVGDDFGIPGRTSNNLGELMDDN